MIIRLENEQDYRASEELTRDAFWNVYRPGCVEHCVLHDLRQSRSFEQRLTFVAEDDGRLVGQLSAAVGELMWGCGSTTAQLVFGPLAVAPERQRQGIGTALLKAALAAAPALDYDCAVLTGSPEYYARFGFVPAAKHGIFLRGHSPTEPTPYFMVNVFSGDEKEWWGGFYSDPDVYSPTPEHVAEFDVNFPAREKLKLLGQLFAE